MSGEENLFQTLAPEIMKNTRLLIIDHDVTRYHSFDLLRYQLYLDTLDPVSGREHFASILPEFQPMLDSGRELADLVHFMQTRVPWFNVYDCFGKSIGVKSMDDYEKKIHKMLADEVAKITPTDVGNRFDIVFDRPGITGYLLRYRGEPYKPTWYDRVTVYESDSLFNLKTAVAVVKKHRLNAIMLGSSELAIRLATRLSNEGYNLPITFMMGRYAYNYACQDGERLYPLHNQAMGLLELNHRHEFGWFDPFSGLSYRFHYMEMEKHNGEESEDSNHK